MINIAQLKTMKLKMTINLDFTLQTRHRYCVYKQSQIHLRSERNNTMTHLFPGRKKLLGKRYHSLPTQTFTDLSGGKVWTFGSEEILLSSTQISNGAWYPLINKYVYKLDSFSSTNIHIQIHVEGWGITRHTHRVTNPDTEQYERRRGHYIIYNTHRVTFPIRGQ